MSVGRKRGREDDPQNPYAPMPQSIEVTIKVTIIPDTWIFAPLAEKDQVKRYCEKGYIHAEKCESLDRVFPRNAEGKPFIPKLWILATMKRAIRHFNLSPKALDFQIVDEKGIPIEHIVIDQEPPKHRRIIFKEDKTTLEYLEYLDSTTPFTFYVKTKHPKEFIEALTASGMIGLMGKTKMGYGRFKIKFEIK